MGIVIRSERGMAGVDGTSQCGGLLCTESCKGGVVSSVAGTQVDGMSGAVGTFVTQRESLVKEAREGWLAVV